MNASTATPREHASLMAPDASSQASRYTQLIDARAAGKILGVPHTWLLTQAREGRIPHHRLDHYVRFDPRDLTQWLAENRIEPRQPGVRFR
ncbi:MAG: helix-turn-helix domain-containing protein [Solirubrobacteraceae bacterium]